MNKNAQKWVEALESGQYKQTKGYLSKGNNRFCCLGVACDLYQKEIGDLQVNNSYSMIFYDNEGKHLPKKVQIWLGLQSTLGSFKHNDMLAKMNDDGYTFKEIADLIRSEPKGLFADRF